jgi:hypothetical protein
VDLRKAKLSSRLNAINITSSAVLAHTSLAERLCDRLDEDEEEEEEGAPSLLPPVPVEAKLKRIIGDGSSDDVQAWHCSSNDRSPAASSLPCPVCTRHRSNR